MQSSGDRITTSLSLVHQRKHKNKNSEQISPYTKLTQTTGPTFSSVQFGSVQLLGHVRLCDPMNRSTSGLPVHHQLLESTQTHVHQVSDAIQPSHPLSSPSPPAHNPSQHQGLFQWVNSLHQVAKVLEFHLQHQSFQRVFRIDFLGLGLPVCSIWQHSLGYSRFIFLIPSLDPWLVNLWGRG